MYSRHKPEFVGCEHIDFTVPVCPIRTPVHLFSSTSHTLICIQASINVNITNLSSQTTQSKYLSHYLQFDHQKQLEDNYLPATNLQKVNIKWASLNSPKTFTNQTYLDPRNVEYRIIMSNPITKSSILYTFETNTNQYSIRTYSELGF